MKLYVCEYFLPFTIFLAVVDIVYLQATVEPEDGNSSLTENPKVNEIETDTQTTVITEPSIHSFKLLEHMEQNEKSSDLSKPVTEITVQEKINFEETNKRKVQESAPNQLNISSTESNQLSESKTNVTLQENTEITERNLNNTEEYVSMQTQKSATASTIQNDLNNKSLDCLTPRVTYREILINQNVVSTTSVEEINQTEKPTDGMVQSGENNSNIKYILQWSEGRHKPFEINMNAGRHIFIYRNCSFSNCVITKTKYLLEDYTKFDAIVFFARDFGRGFFGLSHLPRRRSPRQKYVFASLDYSRRYPASSNKFNGFFNWTWTYRLDSDLTWTHFVVKDMKGNVVAPSKDVQWMKEEEMLPISDKLRHILIGKRKAVAWFDSCSSSASKTYPSISKLSTRLTFKYGITVHRFGKCWSKDCRVKENKDACNEMLRKDFHFYLAFEEQISEDFVSDNVLRAYDNYVVPIVLGGANYNRFLPEGSYIDATEQTTATLTDQIYRLLMDFEKYAGHFKWTNHYTFHRTKENPHTDHICKVCEMMNDEKQLKKVTVHSNFTGWWGITEYKKIKHNPVVFTDDDGLIDAPNIKPSSPVIDFFDKTALVLTSVAKGIVTDVKNLWKKLTRCGHGHTNEHTND